MATIAQIAVEVIGRTERFKRDMSGVTRTLQTVGKHARTAGLAMAPLTAALGLAVRQAVKTGDAYHKMALRTGEAVEDLSALSHAAQISGTDMQVVEKGLRNLQQRAVDFSRGLGEAKDAFEELGIQVTNSTGRMKTGTVLTLEIAEALRNVEDDTRRAALAMDVFGMRAGPQMLPLLREGQAGIRKLMEEATKLGITMSTRDAAAAAEFNDQLTRLKGSIAGVSRDIVMSFLPALQSVVTGFLNMSTETKRAIGIVVAVLGVGGPLMLALSAIMAHPLIAAGVLVAAGIGLIVAEFYKWDTAAKLVNASLTEITRTADKATAAARVAALTAQIAHEQQIATYAAGMGLTVAGGAKKIAGLQTKLSAATRTLLELPAGAAAGIGRAPRPSLGVGAGGAGAEAAGYLPSAEVLRLRAQVRSVGMRQLGRREMVAGMGPGGIAGQAELFGELTNAMEGFKPQIIEGGEAIRTAAFETSTSLGEVASDSGRLSGAIGGVVQGLQSMLQALGIKGGGRLGKALQIGGGIFGMVSGFGAFTGGLSALGKRIGMQHGGDVMRPTLALLGEKGPERVTPFNKLGSSQPQIISVQIDGREIARKTAEYMPGELARRGAA